MSVKIQDILMLKSLHNFTLIAGKGGLSKPVKMVDMLDFGWDREKEYSRTFIQNGSLFDEDSFIISSLMFANGQPEKLYDTVVRLIQCGVSGLAYKTAFYKILPSKICQLADRYLSLIHI